MRNLIPNFILSNYGNDKLSGKLIAATMFVDISGFTAMTQALMKNGKEGAEILTHIINSIFTPAIDSIYNNNGFISTFAGDAFTSIFPKTGEEILEIFNVAIKIQEIFKSIGRQKTKFGNFELSVKVGLSYGKIDWNIIKNETQNSYYFRGQAVDDCAYSEHKCNQAEIIFDKKLEDQLKDLNLNISYDKLDEKYNLLRLYETIGKKRESKKLVNISDKILESFVPKAILKRKIKGEFRDIVSCFISFKENGRINEGISEIISLANKYGGYFNKVDFGDKGGVALVIFGAPIGRERLNERAVDFSIELERNSAKYDFIFRAGLTFGKIFAGFVGSDKRCEYTALGVTVNLSARFMMKADWGESFIDRRIYANLKDDYSIKFLGNYELKGVTGEVPIYQIRRKHETKSFKSLRGKLIGREEEIRQLHDFIKPLGNGNYCGLVYVDGIAGIGKSRLLAQFREDLRSNNYNWFYLPCDEILKKSFNPFVYFLKNYFEQSEDKNKVENRESFEKIYAQIISKIKDENNKTELIRTKSFIAALLNLFKENSLYEKLEPKERYENTLYAVKNLFITLSKLKPVIIVLDDGHWIDNDSLEMLKVLTSNIENHPIIIFSACRYNDDDSLFSFEIEDLKQYRLNLDYLSQKAAEQLIFMNFQKYYPELKADEDLPHSLMTFVWDKSSGNPFYIEQIVLYLKEHNYLDKQFNIVRKKMEIPYNINAIIVARIDRLTEEVREVIKTASVIGKEFIVKILSDMLNSLSLEFKTDQLKAVISEGETQNIWDSVLEIKYIFKHALIRESVYEIQLKERLRELHKLAAETIEKLYDQNLEEYYEDLAFHFEKAEISDKAIVYLGKAGEKAKYNFFNEKALDFIERRIKQLFINLGFDWEYAKGKRITQRRKVILCSIVDTLFEKKYFLTYMGKLDEAKAICDLALDISSRIKDKLRVAKSNHDLATILKNKGQLNDATMLLKKSEKTYKILNQEILLGELYNELGIISYFIGEQRKAFSYFEQQVAIFKKLGNERKYAQALGNIGVINRYAGKFTEAKLALNEELKIAVKIKDKRLEAFALGNLGWVFDGEGDLDKALNYYEKALKINKDLGIKMEIIRMFDNIGFVYQLKNELDKALAYHGKALLLAKEVDDKESIIYAKANLGHVRKKQNKFNEAILCYNEGFAMSKKYGMKAIFPEFMVNKAEVLFLQNKFNKAKELNEKAMLVAKEINNAEFIQKSEELAIKITENI